jgi:hypothetical protein
VKAVTDTLGVARSNVVERLAQARTTRGAQEREGDDALAAEIRALVDQRPSYGYRRITALIRRARRSAGGDAVNAKRVYRLMKKHGLLLGIVDPPPCCAGAAPANTEKPRCANCCSGQEPPGNPGQFKLRPTDAFGLIQVADPPLAGRNRRQSHQTRKPSARTASSIRHSTTSSNIAGNPRRPKAP